MKIARHRHFLQRFVPVFMSALMGITSIPVNAQELTVDLTEDMAYEETVEDSFFVDEADENADTDIVPETHVEEEDTFISFDEEVAEIQEETTENKQDSVGPSDGSVADVYTESPYEMPFVRAHEPGLLIRQGTVNNFVANGPVATVNIIRDRLNLDRNESKWDFYQDGDDYVISDCRQWIDVDNLGPSIGKTVLYNKTLQPTGKIFQAPPFKVIFYDGAILSDGSEAAVEIDVQPYFWAFGTAIPPKGLIGWRGLIVYAGTSEYDTSTRATGRAEAVAYTMTARITQNGEPVEGSAWMTFRDLDQPDATKFPPTYNSNFATEKVLWFSGQRSAFYVPESNWMRINMNDLSFVPTKEDVDTFNSGFGVLVDASEFAFQWAGSAMKQHRVASFLFTSFNQIASSTSSGGVIQTTDETTDTVYKSSAKSGVLYLTAPQGKTLTYIMKANKNYMLDSVTVDDVEITPEKIGDEQYSYTFSGITADHKIHVKWKRIAYDITTEVEHGKIDPDKTVNQGADAVINYSPDEGYLLKQVIVDGEEKSISEFPDKYEFKGVTEDHHIKVVYERTHTITTEVENGTINPAPGNPLVVNAGEDATVTFAPVPNYFIKQLVVDGKEQDISGNPSSVEFKNIAKDHHVKVVYTDEKFRIETSVENGTIDPSVDVNYGANKQIHYSENKNCHLVKVEVDGQEVNMDQYPSRYDFNNVTANHKIHVVYEPNSFRIETSAENGTIDPSMDVKKGENAKISYQPDDGYYLESILVDGKNIDILKNPESYDFNNVEKDHSIHVVYKPYNKITTEVIGGKITDSIQNIKPGEDKNIEYQPNDGNTLIEIKVDDQPVDITQNKDNYPFEDIQENHHILVVYAENPVKSASRIKDVQHRANAENDIFYIGNDDEIIYTISWKNPTSDSKDIMITDPVPEGITFVSASDGGELVDGTVTWNLTVDPEETVQVEFTGKVTGHVSGAVVNKADITVNGVTLPSNEVKVFLAKLPIKTVKTGHSNNVVEAGEELTYTINFENPTDEEREFNITDKLQSGLKFISASDGGTYEAKTGTVTWKVNVKSKQEKNLTLVVSPDETLAGKIIRNTATIDNVPTPPAEPVPVVKAPVKRVVDTEGNDIDTEYVKAGEEITYYISVMNPDDESPLQARLMDDIPDVLEILEVSDEGKQHENRIIWDFVLEKSEEKEFYVRAKVKDSAVGTIIINDAVLTTYEGEERDPEKAIVQTSNEVKNPVIEAPVKKVLNAAGEDIDTRMVRAGDILTYEISVKNPAEKQLKASVKDTLPEGTEIVKISDDGKQTERDIEWNIEVPAKSEKKLTVEVKVLESAMGKKIANKATMTIDGRNIELTSNEVTNPVLPPISKEVLNEKGQDIHDMPVKEGDVVTYRITIKNPSEEDMDVTITDSIPEGMKIGEISDSGKAEGQNITWSVKVEAGKEKAVTVKVQVLKDAYGKMLKNVASVEFPDKQTDKTNEVKNPVLKAPVKHVLDASGKDIDGKFVRVGDKLTYTLTIENPSDRALDMNLSDTLQNGLTASDISDNGKVNGQVITWNLNVAAGAVKTVQFTVTVPEGSRDSIIKNVGILNIPWDGVDDIVIKSNEVQNPVPGTPVKAVLNSEKKSINGNQVYTGDIITYTIKVHNPASVTKSFTITDTLPAGTAVSSIDKDAKADKNVVTWTGNIEAGKERVLTINVKVLATEGELVNKASVSVDNVSVDTNEVRNSVGTCVKFLKTDENGNALAGAVLQIKDGSGNVIQEWTSTSEAFAVKGKLASGASYVLHEKTAPSGYEVAADISFTVNKSGETAQVVMKDKKIPETPKEMPKTVATPPAAPAASVQTTVQSPVIYRNTGDNSNMMVWAAGILAAAAAAFIFYKKKRHA